MKELNELVELAEKVLSPKDAFAGVEAKFEWKARANPTAILAIAEAFRALGQESQKNLDGALAWQQRAEHAEHALKDANVCIVAAEQEIADLNVELSAAQAKLEKQEPVAYWHRSGQVVTRDECHNDKIFAICCKVERPLFTRPAPAINLAELVPDVEENEQAFNAGVNALVDCLEDCGDAEQGLRLALRASRASILRNIEEQSQ